MFIQKELSYKHTKNKSIPFVDWRMPQNRKEGFLTWLDWRLTYNDLDHYMIANTYRDSIKSPTKQPMTEEQALWYCLIYGCTYQTEMAWVIYYNFPDFWNIDLEKMEKWNVDNLDRQRYAKDTKYNKGRIVEQVKSMQNIIGPYGSIKKWIENFLVDDEHKSFENMFNESLNIYKYGRMTSWLFNQALFETGNIKLKPNSMLASDPSNWSVRSGLCYLYNRDDIIEAKTDHKMSSRDLEFIIQCEQELYAEAFDNISDHNRAIFSNFLLESHLCQYKKLMLGGDYAGHSSGDHFTRASYLKDKWSEVDFNAFFEDSILNHHPLVRGKQESKALRNLCKETGQLINMHMEYPFLPDMYLELDITPDLLKDKGNDSVIMKSIDSYTNNSVSLFDFT